MVKKDERKNPNPEGVEFSHDDTREIRNFAPVKRINHIIIFIAVFTLIFSVSAEAQCAMCKAMAETGSHDGIPVNGGINNAIIYLMVVPYILLFILFRKKIVSFYREWKAMWK